MTFKKTIIVSLIVTLTVFILLLYWSTSSTDKIYTKSIIYNIDNLETTNFRDYDSIELSPSDLYVADEIKKLFQGEQYRAAWSAKVKVPIVFLDTLKGGMNVKEEGGGKQTHSLEMKGADGITYTLRSVNKDAELARSAQVLHTNPKMYFVPKQKRLGSFNDDFGNRLYLLEYETKSDVNYTPLKSIIKIIDTDNLQELKKKFRDSLHIDESALVRSRLFDFLIGDWDRHTKQWAWAIQKTEQSYIAIPVAGDRDNAFFNLEGLIPTILANKHVVKELRPFEEDIDYLEGLVYPFDRYFLSQTTENIFIEEAEHLQNLLKDNVIESALEIWPKNVRVLDGDEIIRKIKERRNDLKNYAIQFYTIIQKQGTVTEPLKGSEDLDLSDNLINCFECD